MKVILNALIVASLTYMTSSAATVQKTTAIAADESYPVFIVGLRNKATDFITREKIRMMLEVDDLRKQNLDYRADELFEQHKETYFDLEEDIDMIFEKISRNFLAQATELDQQNASANEKIALIARTKENAQKVVTTKLQQYESLLKNNTPSVDF